MLQHILANFRQPGSYSLALQWLYSLFVAYSQADVLAEHETAASAHVNAPQVRPGMLTRSKAYPKVDIPAEHETAASDHVNAPQVRPCMLSRLKAYSKAGILAEHETAASDTVNAPHVGCHVLSCKPFEIQGVATPRRLKHGAFSHIGSDRCQDTP